jgi:hypothetical protein
VAEAVGEFLLAGWEEASAYYDSASSTPLPRPASLSTEVQEIVSPEPEEAPADEEPEMIEPSPEEAAVLEPPGEEAGVSPPAEEPMTAEAPSGEEPVSTAGEAEAAEPEVCPPSETAETALEQPPVEPTSFPSPTTPETAPEEEVEPEPTLPTPLAPAEPTPSEPSPPLAVYDDVEAAVLEALREGNSAEALRLLDEAEQIHGRQPQLALLRAQVYAAQLSPEREADSLQEAVALDESLYEPRLQLAAGLEARGLWQEAAQKYREAITLFPLRPLAYIRLAALRDRQSQPNLALETLREGLDLIPEELGLLEALAKHYERRDMLSEAEEVWLAVVARAEGRPLADAHRALGDLHLDRQDFISAYTAYAAAQQLYPSSYTGEMKVLLRESDHLVAEALERARLALSPGPGQSREERYTAAAGAVEDLNHTASLATAFAADFPDPVTYAKRTLYYSLALEAATNALVYIDTGEADLFHRSQARFEDARQAGLELSTEEKAKLLADSYR